MKLVCGNCGQPHTMPEEVIRCQRDGAPEPLYYEERDLLHLSGEESRGCMYE